MKKIAALLPEYRERLARARVFSPEEDLSAIIAHFLGMKIKEIEQNEDVFIEKSVLEKIEQAIQRREKREPIERIFGYVSFYDVKIKIIPGVFRPIPESLDLVEHTINSLKERKNEPLRVLDLGTGTGCILLALLHELPHASGLGIDLEDSAIKLAQDNAISNNLHNRAEFRTGNWAEGIKEKFDLIVCNPPAAITEDIPYLEPEMKDYEPMLALDGGKDGLEAYRHLVKAFSCVAKPEALGVFEVNYKHREAALFQKAGYPVELKLNYRGNPNCIVVRNKQQKWWQKLL